MEWAENHLVLSEECYSVTKNTGSFHQILGISQHFSRRPLCKLQELQGILEEKQNIRPPWFQIKIIVLEISGNLVEKRAGSRKEDKSFLQTGYMLGSLYILI